METGKDHAADRPLGVGEFKERRTISNLYEADIHICMSGQ